MASDVEAFLTPNQEFGTTEASPEVVEALAVLSLKEEETDTDEAEAPEISWRDETEPEEKVERFLENNAHLFGAVTEAWKDVRVSQQAYIAHTSTITGSSGRQERRRRAKQLGSMADPRTTIGLARIKSQELLQHIENKQEITGERLPKLLEACDEAIEQSRDPESSLFDAVPPEIREHVRKSDQLSYQIVGTRAKALITQAAAVTEITELFADDTAVPVAIERIKTLAATGDATHTEYPGFIEVVATHVQQEGPQNVVQTAFRRNAPEPASYAKEFIEYQLADHTNEHKRKELGAAFGVMSLISTLVERDFDVPAERLQEAFAEQADAWPPALLNELQLFATSKTNAAWENVRTLLAPLVREGRLHVEAVHASIRTNLKSGNSGPQTGRQASNQPSKLTVARGKSRGNLSFTTTALETDHNALLGIERAPISKFGVLVNSGRKSERYALETVDTLEELFEFSNLAEFAEKYRSDANIEPTLHRALEILTTNPYDAAFTCQSRNGRYTLEYGDESTARTPRRFSAQHLPGLRHGSLATKTRIIYDVLNEQGGQRLVVYGAFHKQDVESFVTLPRRRV